MILFIHGFGSCGWGDKSLTLRRHFGIERVIAPDLPFCPERAIAHLRDLIDRYAVESVVGSSLGGYYATYLNAERPLPTVLINPAVEPHALLHDYLGEHRRWCDDMPFRVIPAFLQTLIDMRRDGLSDDERYLVLLQTADEVLDYRLAQAFYADKDIDVTEGGSHRFEHLEAHLPRIAAWLAEQTKEHG